jgi:hypothetical protein
MTKNNSMAILIPILITALAIALFVRVFLYRQSFDEMVRRSHRNTVGYDQKLISVVTRLERELAERASFGYTGGKDPMTGTTRQVVRPARRAPVRKAPVRTAAAPDTVTEKKPAPDPVRLTAIIFDDERQKHTAIIMDGERSVSVEMGDRVRDRRVTLITDKAVYMESPTAEYRYDVFGKRERRPTTQVLPEYMRMDLGG